ncbi:MAG: hypothetical protein E3J83_01765 [Candidatus Atribacteria bacterium]|nr:MAG: hypothetical protein E3J83_01765 [Candidatus Atribacteria bacterium]
MQNILNIITQKLSDIDINSIIGYIVALLAVMIAVVGWLVQYKLNIKANERNFINSIKNQARIEIIKNFKSKEEWLSDVSFIEHQCSMFIYGISSYQNFLKSINNIAISKANNSEWIYILEGYEILFPKITEIRKKMVTIGIETNELFYNFVSRASNIARDTEIQKAFLNDIFKRYKFSSIFLDFQMLMNDLKIYIQNETIGTIVNSKAELRIPKDKSLPYLEIFGDKIIIKNYNKYIDRIDTLQEFLKLY